VDLLKNIEVWSIDKLPLLLVPDLSSIVALGELDSYKLSVVDRLLVVDNCDKLLD